MPDNAPAPAPTAGREAPTKLFPPSDIRSTVSDPSSPNPTTTIDLPSNVLSNILNPVADNTSVYPTE